MADKPLYLWNIQLYEFNKSQLAQYYLTGS
jgi:hypothetical protein